MNNLDVASDKGLQLRLANQRKGKKRQSGLLEEDTNSCRCEKLQKKRKLYLQGFGKENVRSETMKNSMTKDQEASDVVLQSPTLQSQTTYLFPCNIERGEKDGHLFSLEYIRPITSAVISNENNAVKLFPKPNYFCKQTNLRPRMRTILFT